jgi:hypothetical protein
MKSIIFYVSGPALIFTTTLSATLTYFSPQSQSASAPQQLIDFTMNYHIHNDPDYGLAGSFTITPEYTRTFRNDKLIDCLIGKACLSTTDDDRCCDTAIVISGSRVANRQDTDWLADYFGLPTDFLSTVALKPKLDNFLVHLNLLVPFGCTHFFLRLYAPITHTRTNMDFCEQIYNSGNLGYDAGYFDTIETPRENLLQGFSDFIGNEQVPTFESVTFRPLQYGKWLTNRCNRLNKTGLSDVMIFLGGNLLYCDSYHLAISALGIIPTGNKPRGEYLFEPIVGNGNHPGAGGALSAHFLFWEDTCCSNSFGIYMYGWVAHLFTASQCRTFDLVNSCNSRYMLAEKVSPPVDQNLWANPMSGNIGGSMQPNGQFKSLYTTVANLTHRPIKVKVPVYGQVAGLVNLTYCGWNIDVGYNYWARSCDEICFDKNCKTQSLLMQQWALKGDSHVFGFSATGGTCPTGPVSPTQPCLDLPIPLSSTQSQATLMSGLNNFVGPNPDQGGTGAIRPTRNPGVDNDQFARLVENAAPDAFILDRFSASGGLQTKTSFEPILLNDSLIDCDSALSRGSSHTLFTYLGYAWLYDEDCWIPFVGIGGKVEWAPTEEQKSTSCTRCALSQWGVWLKAGITFH